jgi:hypothetical protein
MNDSELEKSVRATLHDRFPIEMAPQPGFSEPVRAPWKQMRYVPVLGICGALALVLVVAWAASSFNGRQRTSVASQAPAWAQGCFSRWAPPEPRDHDFLGLTSEEARQLANQRGQALMYIGAGGTCLDKSTLVASDTPPVRVAFSTGNLSEGLPANSVVVLANSNPTAMFP